MGSVYAAAMLHARQSDDDDDDRENGTHWWYSDTGRTVKWSIFLGIIILITLYLFGGYIHARSRIKKGQPPLRYHRWMVRRPMPAHQRYVYYYPNGQAYHAQPGVYRPADHNAYGMQNMNGPPPPVYDPDRPPGYAPPEGGSKVDPNQGAAGGYGAPTYQQPPPPQGGASTGAPPPPQQQQGDDFAPPPGPPPPAVNTNNTGNTNPFR